MTEKPQDFDLHRSALHLLHRADQCVGALFQAETQELDVTPRQFAVLLAVAQLPGSSQAVLVAQTGIDRSTMTDLVRRLERKGLVRRRRTRQDARAWAVMLTEKGERTLAAAEAAAKSVDATLRRIIAGPQAQAFLAQLAAIVDALRGGEAGLAVEPMTSALRAANGTDREFAS